MLDFVSRHGIKPKVEVYPHLGANSVSKAFDRLEAGTPRYRVVLTFQ
jgi:D-arabinose 1-dehydrogenase-like Zn-dependent alcohol dehydrogenase